MLLVKPSYGCSTPAIFKALDLDSRSTADPLELLKDINGGATEAGAGAPVTLKSETLTSSCSRT